jgi:soluble P-type ATPase
MIVIDIPGFGTAQIKYLVSDFTGTLSVDGVILDGVRDRLERLSQSVEIHIVTADIHRKAESELRGIKCTIAILSGDKQDIQKEQYINSLGPEHVFAVGNGNNDRKMLAAARIGVAVCLSEGVSTDALKSATVFVPSVIDALDLLVIPDRLRATLRSA